jgi:signal transduction histidine kinase
MTIDPRILKLREAAAAMRAGRFDVDVPFDPEDEVGQLGRALVELGQALESQFSQMRALSQVTARINAGVLLDEVADRIFDSFRPLIPYDRIGLSLLEQDDTVARARWARSDFAEIKLPKGYSAALAGSSLERVLATGEPRILNDLEAYLRDHPRSESTRLIVAEGVRSSLTCPLVANGKAIGFLFFSSRKPGTYQHVHVELFQEIAGQLALIVEKSRLYQQLVELGQVRNRFLGIAAHDLRSPIAILLSYTELLDTGYLGPLNERQADAVHRIRNVCDGMLALVNDLLDLSAIESGHLELKLEDVPLGEYLRGCREIHAVHAEAKGIAVDLELPDDAPAVRMDPRRIDQVLANLISNAVKFSYPKSRIVLAAGREADAAAVSVRDHGQGIPAAEQAQLFSEFRRTSVRPTAGERSTGLGLAIVKKIVEAHGGRVRLESEAGAGSTFTFTLPLASGDAGNGDEGGEREQRS